MRYTIRQIYGHVEFYDAAGAFVFSADSVPEAYRMMEETE